MAVSIVQQKQIAHYGNTGITFDAALGSSSNVVVAVGTTNGGGAPSVPSGWTSLGTASAADCCGANAGRVFVFARVAGSTSAGPWFVPANAQARLYELADADIGDIEVLTLSNQNPSGSTGTFDLGTLSGTLGVAFMAIVETRSTDQRPQAGGFDMGSWNERYDNAIDPTGSTAYWTGIGDSTLAGSIDPAWDFTESSGFGQDIGEWAGVAVLFNGLAGLACDFSATPTTGVAPLAVDFTDLTTGTPDGWDWDFGDGGTSTSQNPSHTFAEGTWSVTLTATRSGDSAECSTTISSYIVATAAHAGVFIDWGNDGFEVGTDDEISGTPQNVVRWVIRRGSGPELTGGSQPGSATLTLKNPADIYNPRNVSSPLYANLHDGPAVWIGVNSDGVLTGDDPRGLFGGRITDITLVPSGGATVSPFVEISCEDMLGWAQRTPVQIDYAEGRSHGELRLAALLAAGESRYSLAHEIQTMPLSHADGNLLGVLDDINGVNGTRHFAKPEDLYTDWFTYTTRNRFWRLDATVDGTVDAGAEHVTGTDGWRLSADTVINRQKATVTPIIFTPGTFTVWEAEKLPLGVTDVRPFSRIVDFDDVVRDPVLDLASTGDTVTSVLTPFATAAKIDLTVATGDSASITRLSVEGRLARRLVAESAQADNATSQALPRGIREGSEIGNEYLGVIAEARGIAEHVVWRFGTPQLRPTLTVENWIPEQFELDLYDVISFTSTQLGMDAVLFEIVGLTHEGNVAAKVGSTPVVHHVTTYVLQECRVQSGADWFLLDDDPGSLLDDGVSELHY